jgi:hypothetical protein
VGQRFLVSGPKPITWGQFYEGLPKAARPRLTLRMMSLADFVQIKGLGWGVVVRNVVVDGGGELGHTFEDPATNTIGGYFSKPTFNKIEPRRRSRNRNKMGGESGHA